MAPITWALKQDGRAMRRATPLRRLTNGCLVADRPRNGRTDDHVTWVDNGQSQLCEQRRRRRVGSGQ